MTNVTKLETKTLSAKEVAEAAKNEVKKEKLEQFKKDYIKLLRQKEDLELAVRNVNREIAELEEKIGE